MSVSQRDRCSHAFEILVLLAIDFVFVLNGEHLQFLLPFFDHFAFDLLLFEFSVEAKVLKEFVLFLPLLLFERLLSAANFLARVKDILAEENRFVRGRDDEAAYAAYRWKGGKVVVRRDLLAALLKHLLGFHRVNDRHRVRIDMEALEDEATARLCAYLRCGGGGLP